MRRRRQSRFEQVIDLSSERVDVACQLRTVVARHLDEVDTGADRSRPVPLHRAARSFVSTEDQGDVATVATRTVFTIDRLIDGPESVSIPVGPVRSGDERGWVAVKAEDISDLPPDCR